MRGFLETQRRKKPGSVPGLGSLWKEVDQQAVDFVGYLKLHPVASVVDPFVSERARHVLLRPGHLTLSESNVTTAPHTERRGLNRR
jgi:hypothetical protein